MKEELDEWKRGYYKVCHLLFPQTMCTDGCSTCRKNSRYLMMTHRIWAILRSGMYMDCSEWCTIIIVVLRGVGSTIIIMRLVSQVSFQSCLVVLNTDGVQRPEGHWQHVVLFSAWHSIPSLWTAYGCPSLGKQRQHSQRLSRAHFFIHFRPLT